MINVCTMLWDPNDNSFAFSRAYDETWVDKLYRGFRRHLDGEFRFICFSDRDREFEEPVNLARIHNLPPDYGSYIEPFRLGEPMILVGLDTAITGDINHLADYCMTGDQIMLPRDPYHKERSCNGVALVPEGHSKVYDNWNGENDMVWLRQLSTTFLDDKWPGHVVSYKGEVRVNGLGDARIVYFHGQPKMHQMTDPWIREFWQ